VTVARRECVIADTSVLVNFLAVDRAGLLLEHPQLHFFITDHVRAEVTEHYPEQFSRLDAILSNGSLQQLRIDTPAELEIFAALTVERRLGSGECAAIAAAVYRGSAIAIDDKAAIRLISRSYPGTPVHTTRSIMVGLIELAVLDVAEADAIKADWEARCRFRLPFESFRNEL
jgi:predicted nucleic acid-binding protein